VNIADAIFPAAAANGTTGIAPEAGRCIYCDQRCDAKATFHAYCVEVHLGEEADRTKFQATVQRP
jgi:hypothetical protein